MSTSRQVAVIGGGVAGVVAAHLISQKHEVTLFERENYLGGHTNTIEIPSGPDADIPADTGFIVLNDRTYPLFHKFLAQLKVPVRYANMGFGFYSEETGLAYGSATLNSLFAQRRNLFRPAFLRMLLEIRRFWHVATERLKQPFEDNETLGEFLARHEFSAAFSYDFLVPISAAIWSSPDQRLQSFPLRTFLHFYRNHGLLGFFDQPRWQTVVGGSYQYLLAFRKSFHGTVLTGRRVRALRRPERGASIVVDQEGEHSFDAVVVATHADEVLPLLEDADDDEKRLFGAWKYQRNDTYLHTDSSVMPPLRRAWASWNYVRLAGAPRTRPIAISYYMNCLQGFSASADYFVTLNPAREICADRIIRRIEYYHPMYTSEAESTQEQIRQRNGTRATWFCGSYLGFGFHEDAVRSAVDVGATFGGQL